MNLAPQSCRAVFWARMLSKRANPCKVSSKNFFGEKKKRSGLKRCPKLVHATAGGNKNNSQPKEKIAVEERMLLSRKVLTFFTGISLFTLFLRPGWWGDKLRSSRISSNWPPIRLFFNLSFSRELPFFSSVYFLPFFCIKLSLSPSQPFSLVSILLQILFQNSSESLSTK